MGGKWLIGHINSKDQKIFDSGLPEDWFFMTEIICYIAKTTESLCFFYIMHENCVTYLMLP